MFDYDRAIEKVAGAVDKGFSFVDDFFYTKEEKSSDTNKRAEDYHKFMALTSVEAQLIRSKKRAQLVTWVVIPYVISWCAKLPLMIISVYRQEFTPVLTMWDLWLKLYTPIVAAFGGGYIGYYGIQMIAGTFKRNNNNKKDKE